MFIDHDEGLGGVKFLDLLPIDRDVAERVAFEGECASMRRDEMAHQFFAVSEDQNVGFWLRCSRRSLRANTETERKQ